MSASIEFRMKTWPFYQSLTFLDEAADQGTRYCSTSYSSYDDDNFDIEQECTIPSSRQGENDEISLSSRSPVPCNLLKATTNAVPSALRKQTTRKGKPVKGFEEIATAMSALRDGDKDMDTLDVTGLMVTHKLRELQEVDADLCDEWKVKVDELILAMSRAKIEARSKK